MTARRDHGDCTCKPPPITEGPEEDCPQHGRPYSEWVEFATRDNQRVAESMERARAVLARHEQTLDKAARVLASITQDEIEDFLSRQPSA